MEDDGARLRAMGADLRLMAARLDDRRVALSRYALVWWQGEAAEAYQQRVARRVAALAVVAGAAEAVAAQAEAVAEEVDAWAELGAGDR